MLRIHIVDPLIWVGVGGGGALSTVNSLSYRKPTMHSTVPIKPLQTSTIQPVSGSGALPRTVRKMDLILCSIERRLQMQFSMARKCMLQPFEHSKMRDFTLDMPGVNLRTQEGEPTSLRSVAQDSTTTPLLHMKYKQYFA